MTDLVSVKGLAITATSKTDDITLVSGIDFSLKQGEVLALIGESGSGKTTIALSLLGYTRRGCRVSQGSIRVGEYDMAQLDNATLELLRGNKVCYIAQSAAASFNPGCRLIDQVIEGALIHKQGNRKELEAKAIGLFRDLALPDPEIIGQRYPHQVSGGQLQRIMAAMAMISDPILVILDEPTTALDVTTQIEVLRAFKRVVAERGATAVYVSHDLAVVAQMADKILVLNGGRIVEQGRTEQLLTRPQERYTQQLMAAARPEVKNGSDSPVDTESPLLQVSGLIAGYGKKTLGLPSIRVLEDINLTVYPGQSIGIIGESGSGKSTLARAIAGMLEPARGQIHFKGTALAGNFDDRNPDQFRRIQMVFQNADTALNPSQTIERILSRPLERYFNLKGEALRSRVNELLDLVRLPRELAKRRPGALSGGQKQRVNLARALAAKPDLLLCDEVTSALDTVVGAAILELLSELRTTLGVSYLFVSHDISTVRALCDEIVVMYRGHKVEHGSRASFENGPYHPYTNLLINSVPELRQGWLESQSIAAPWQLPTITAPTAHDELCPFLNRCPTRIEGLCNHTAPARRTIVGGSEILCHRESAELELAQFSLKNIALTANRTANV